MCLQGFVLCGSASFQAAGTAIFKYFPWEGEIGCLKQWSSYWEQSQTSHLSIPCRTRLVYGWGVAPLIKDTAAVARGARDGVGRRESPGLCSRSLCARARESSIQPGSCCCARGHAAWGGSGWIHWRRVLCPPHGLSWPNQEFLGLSPLWICPHIGDWHLLLPVKLALSLPELSGELLAAAPGGFTPGKDPALLRS